MQKQEKQGVQGGEGEDTGEAQYRIETEEDLQEDDLEPPFMIAV